MRLPRLVVVVSLWLALATAASAAEPKNAAGGAAKPGASPAKPAAPGPQREAFEKLMTQWKAMLAEMGSLQAAYRKANAEQRSAIEKQWKDIVTRGEALEPQLIAAAEKAYVEAPNADKSVSNLLIGVVADSLAADNYEEAARIAQLLIDHNCPENKLYNFAGMAAFALQDFATAEKYLKLAQEKGVTIGLNRDRDTFDQLVSDFLSDPKVYHDAWAKEQSLRTAEAKADDLPRVLLRTTKGDIELELLENEAPNTVASFISLVSKGFYDGLTFHRVLSGFMAQGGDPKGTGVGGPGYMTACECYRPEHRLHFRGSLSMANAGRDTNGSQFFLTFLPTTHLDGKHTVFGRVIKGFDVLHKLQRRDPQDPNAPRPDKIIEAKVLRKRNHEYQPTKLEEK